MAFAHTQSGVSDRLIRKKDLKRALFFKNDGERAMRISRLVLISIVLTLGGVVAGWAQQHSTSSISRYPIVRRTSNTWNKWLDFPSKRPEVTASLVEFAPGAVGPRQVNPYPRYIYVLKGTLTVDLADGDSVHFPSGSFVISGETWVTPRNNGPDILKMLIIDQTEAGQSNVVMSR